MKMKDFGKEPIFLPDATKGAIKFVTTEQLKETGTKGIVVNTLHLLINLGVEKMLALGGIGKMMNWDGYILSDSGGFQVYSLLHSKRWEGKIDKTGVVFKAPNDGKEYQLTPESSIDIQLATGSHVLVCLDDCRFSSISRNEAEISVKRTLEWSERCKRHFEKRKKEKEHSKKLLSAVVQGAGYLDLREKCAKELVKMDFDGYNFGGYVVNDEGKLVYDELEAVISNLPRDRFRYVMGVGKPQDIIDCFKMGYTVFDTVLVTRNARHGTLYSFDKEDYLLRIKNSEYLLDNSPVDSTCDCETCKNYSRSYVNYLLKIGEPIGYTLASVHNLRFYQRLINSLSL